MCGYHTSNNIVAGKIKIILEDNNRSGSHLQSQANRVCHSRARRCDLWGRQCDWIWSAGD